jgi:hypothetical protein
VSEESMARLGIAFMFLDHGATVEEAAVLAWDEDVFAALTEMRDT